MTITIIYIIYIIIIMTITFKHLLVCPYTLLAHYVELDWAATYGVSDRLIRVSVGIEDIEAS